MAIIDDFLKAFIYFVDNGVPEKTAKELAEQVSGSKVTDDKTLKAFAADVKKSGGQAPKKLATRKERGDLTFINTKIGDPQKSKLVLKGLDGTTESVYSQFRREQEAIKKGLIKDLKFVKQNNISLGAKDKDNILYNMKIYNSLTKKVDELANELTNAGKEPQKIYTDFTNNLISTEPSGILKSMDDSMKKIKKALDEIENIRSGKADDDRRAIVKQMYQGKGYGPNEGIYRTLSRQFLADEIEAGRIETTPAIYNAMREGGHPFIDSIKVFRHHYGDDAFDILGKYVDSTYDFMQGSRYPGRFEFRKLGLVVKNKKAPGKTYAHYSTPSEIDAEIKSIDNLISEYQKGESPMIRSKQELLEAISEQNKRRAKFVKIKNEIAPQETEVLPGDDLLDTAEVIPIKEDRAVLNGVELFGDETFEELKFIGDNGVHPRKPKNGFARGGIVEVHI
tara:strand:- start:100 stop:1452 length:1353 start_codon:yes stop_codon:yes gene_type:complete